MILNHFFSDGWIAYEKNGHTPIPLTGSRRDDLMEFTVPPGDYTVIVELPTDFAERAGLWITLLTLGSIAGLGFWRTYTNQPPQIPVAATL